MAEGVFTTAITATLPNSSRLLAIAREVRSLAESTYALAQRLTTSETVGTVVRQRIG
jgi:hypothetical protein